MRPTLGPASGQTTVIIDGTGFMNVETLSCSFSNVSVVGYWISNRRISCVSPQQNAERYVNLTVTNDGVDFVKVGEYQYVGQVTLERISPRHGPMLGGTTISVKGTNFVLSSELSCKFGFIRVPASFVDTNTVRCISPAYIHSDQNQEVPVAVSTNGVDFSLSMVQFEYLQRAVSWTLEPRIGTSSTVVAFSRINETVSDVRCKIVLANTTIDLTPGPSPGTCVIPEVVALGYGTTVDIVLLRNDVPLATFGFEYFRQAEISDARILHDHSLNESVVVVRGSYFTSRINTHCTIANHQMSVVFSSSQQLFCKVPKTTRYGPVEVRMSGIAEAKEVMYLPPPAILRFAPHSGPLRGNTDVIFLVENMIELQPESSCWFGVRQVPMVLHNRTAAVCVSPALTGAPRSVQLHLTINGQHFDYVFHYNAVVELLHIHPTSGTIRGGTEVLISGSGFVENMSVCSFTVLKDEVWVGRVLSPESIVCRTPHVMAPGEAIVRVSSNNGVDWSEQFLRFNYIAPSFIVEVSPLQGPESGGTPVTVLVANHVLTSAADVRCMFGDVTSSDVSITAQNEVVCVSPILRGAGSVLLTLWLDGNEIGTKLGGTAAIYTFYPDMVINKVVPSYGLSSGGQLIVLSATNVSGDRDYTCVFNELAVAATVLEDSRLACYTPEWKEIGSVERTVRLSVSYNKLDQAHKPANFTYLTEPQVQRATPLRGPLNGETEVHFKIGWSTPSLQYTCKFGSTVVNSSLVKWSESNQFLSCASPTSDGPGEVPLTLLAVTEQWTRSVFTTEFVYEHPMYVRTVVPRAVRPFTGEGHYLTVYGGGFTPDSDLVCRFGSSIQGVAAEFMSERKVRCFMLRRVILEEPSGIISVKITNNGVNLASSYVRVVENRTILSVWPSHGPVDGYTKVSLNLTKAQSVSSNVECLFGNTSVNAVWRSPSLLECFSPPYQGYGSKTVDVALTSSHVFYQGAWQFAYKRSTGINETTPSSVVVTGVHPNSIHRLGGVELEVFGANFSGASCAQCDFDGERVPTVVVNATVLRCITPSLPPASDRQVLRLISLENSASAAFELGVNAVVTVTGMYPKVGPLLGGTQVVFEGTNFPSNAEHLVCVFGETRRVEMVYLHRNGLACVTPPFASPGYVPLAIQFLGQSFHIGAMIPLEFLYVKYLGVRLVSPRLGVGGRSNAVEIEILDVGLAEETEDVRCRFGDKLVKANVSQQGVVMCASPVFHVDTRTEVALELVDGKHDAVLAQLTDFVLVPPPILESISPNTGYNLSQTLLTVTGSNFVDSDDLVCLVGGKVFTTRVESSTLARCLVNETAKDVVKGTIAVSLAMKSIGFETDRFGYKILNVPKALSAIPDFGTREGGTFVSITGSWDQTQGYSCIFGHRRVDAILVNESTVVCTTPASTRSGIVSMKVLSSHAEVAFESAFEYLEPLVVSGVSVRLLTAYRPAAVAVYGGNFSRDTLCLLNGVEGTARLVTTSKLHCSIPAELLQDVGQKILSVRRSGDAVSDSSKVVVSVGLLPQVTRVLNHSPLLKSIEVEGSNFVHVETLSCKVGTSVSKGFYVSDRKVRCNMDIAAMHGRLGISNNRVDYVFAQDFTVAMDRPKILALGPSNGPAEGSTLLRFQVYGEVEEREILCRFGEDATHAFVRFQEGIYLVGCPTPPFASLTGESFTKPVYVSTRNNNFIYSGMNFTYKATVAGEQPLLLEVPIAGTANVIAVFPDVAKAHAPGKQMVLVQGRRFRNTVALGCRFGDLFVRGVYLTDEEMYCNAPKRGPGKVSLQVTVDGLNFSKSAVQFTYTERMVVHSVVPRFGPVEGMTWVTLKGSFRSAAKETLGCAFGGRPSEASDLIDNTTLRCLSPASSSSADSLVKVELILNGIDIVTAESNAEFNYFMRRYIERINPGVGPVSGGTSVSVRLGSPPPSGSAELIWCLFGSKTVRGRVLQSTDGPSLIYEYACVSPAGLQGPTELLLVVGEGPTSANLTSSVRFEYRNTSAVVTSSVMHGPAYAGGTPVKIRSPIEGTVWCKFGEKVARGYRDAGDVFVCRSPRSASTGKVDFSISSNLQQFEDIGSFTYDKDLSVTAIRPRKGSLQGQTSVFVSGNNFLNVSTLACRFGRVGTVQALFISKRLLMCPTPLLRAARLSTTTEQLSILVEVSNNGVNFNGNSAVAFIYMDPCSEGGRFCSFGKVLAAPPGTYASEGVYSSNFTLCEPGYFQPRPGSSSCLPCPVGYFCPNSGLAKPLLCLPGMVCDTLGQRYADTPCPRGRYCLAGTKSKYSDDMQNVHVNQTHIWKFLATSTRTHLVYEANVWSFERHPTPATGFSRQLEPPDVSSLTGEVPALCPFGHYCPGGTRDKASAIRCMEGHFCPMGSERREGVGSCPTGHYCPNSSIALSCPTGHMCPRVGNVKPTPCLPGSFNPFLLQSRCTACPIGHVCPGYGRTFPMLCPAGFVCLAEGLSAPVIQCPAGYYCEAGTSTLVLPGHTDSTEAACMPFPMSEANEPISPQGDVDCLEFNLTAIRSYLLNFLALVLSPTYQAVLVNPLRPLPCPPGTFCLGGVATNLTIDWIQVDSDGRFAPQTCQEGTYCEFASSTAGGTGECYAGHYCPPGSDLPVHAPIGTFSGKQGSIASSLCFPGTYSPLNSSLSCRECPAGFSCLGYGTYEPKICPKGTYRSLADSVTCKLCPAGTYSAHTGSPDISLCEPCPASRVCGIEQMTNLSQSVACSTGYMCGEATESSIQYAHPCSAGYFCAENTPSDSGYDNACERGYFCSRNTKASLRRLNECPVGYYCPDGSSVGRSMDILCPAGTTTATAGNEQMSGCDIDPVFLCDKDLGYGNDAWHYSPEIYYSDFTYTNNEGNERVFDSTDPEQFHEVRVQRRILPVNTSASVSAWTNDTIQVFRGCPTTIPAVGGTMLTIIGRNFIDTLELSCRIRGWTAAGQVASNAIVTPAFFISRTRVQCRFPGAGLLDSRTLAEVHVSVSNRGSAFAATYATFGLTFGLTALGDVTMRDIDLFNQDLGHCTGDVVSMLQANHEGSDVYSLVEFDGPTMNLPQTQQDFLHVESMLQSANWKRNATLVSFETFLLRLDGLKAEEGERELEKGWYVLKGVNTAYLEVNFGHIHEELQYGVHYQLALLVANSTCSERVCQRTAGTNVEEFFEREVSPCNRPLEFTTWFLSEEVIKSSVFHLSLLALEDILFRVEVHILHGMYVPFAPHFENTVSIATRKPTRANSTTHHEQSAYSKRILGSIVSSTGEEVFEEYFFTAILDSSTFEEISPPLNMPRRYEELGHGRVLARFNNSAHEGVHVKDTLASVKVGPQWWKHKGASAEEMHANIIKYRETVHDFDLTTARER